MVLKPTCVAPQLQNMMELRKENRNNVTLTAGLRVNEPGGVPETASERDL